MALTRFMYVNDISTLNKQQKFIEVIGFWRPAAVMGNVLFSFTFFHCGQKSDLQLAPGPRGMYTSGI